MKSIIKKYNSYLLAAVMAFSVSSCKKLLDIPPNPPDKITVQQAFADSLNVQSVIAGIYNSFGVVDGLSLYFHNGGITVYTGLSGDEFVSMDPDNQAVYLPFYNNSLLPGNEIVSYKWITAYTNIYSINAALEGVAISNGLSAGLKQRLKGELKTVRALYYFNLVNLFGGVPLVTNTDFKVNALSPRSPVDKVYELIFADLEEARTLLAPEYPSAGRARPNLYTATALLAKANLYRKNWQKAADLSGEVIDAGLYTLQSDLNTVFLNESTEAIWQLPCVGGDITQTNEAFFFVPQPDIVPKFELTPALINAFETDDQRKTNWVGEAVVNGLSYYYPYKYKNNYVGMATTIEDYMILRLGEQYLIRAEARAQLSQSANALDDLNVIRQRAGLTDLSFTDTETLLSDIMQERRIELFAEWGNRWYDLKRTDQANSVLGTKPGWQATDILYPIPQSQREANPFLSQNPGY